MSSKLAVGNEKILKQVEHVETFDSGDDIITPEQRKEEEKRLVRLLDMRLLPAVILIFLMNYTDVSHAP